MAGWITKAVCANPKPRWLAESCLATQSNYTAPVEHVMILPEKAMAIDVEVSLSAVYVLVPSGTHFWLATVVFRIL